jgi:hypothetical protein
MSLHRTAPAHRLQDTALPIRHVSDTYLSQCAETTHTDGYSQPHPKRRRLDDDKRVYGSEAGRDLQSWTHQSIEQGHMCLEASAMATSPLAFAFIMSCSLEPERRLWSPTNCVTSPRRKGSILNSAAIGTQPYAPQKMLCLCPCLNYSNGILRLVS